MSEKYWCVRFGRSGAEWKCIFACSSNLILQFQARSINVEVKLSSLFVAEPNVGFYEFIQTYHADLSNTGLLNWQGTPFADICELTDVPEGMIVRTIVRLDETCREFRNAAAIMGNSALHKKMETASNAIKRDIVFAASLYITGI